jgi:hypothetical protein
VPDDDLRSVPGLQEIHRRALGGKLGITSLRALADADQRAVYTAMASIRPRPSLSRIAAWQGDARSKLRDVAVNGSDWHTAASFAVIFAQRQVAGNWERRVEAEQTEVEPASAPRQWPGWQIGSLSDWMLDQLGLSEHGADSGDRTASHAAATAVVKVAARSAPALAERADLRFDNATVTDRNTETDLIRAGTLAAAPQEDLSPPVRLRVDVRGGRSGQQLLAAVWFRRRAAPGWSPQEPVAVNLAGHAEFDLSSVPPGRHDVRLLAWAADAQATLAAVTLPNLMFRQDAQGIGEVAVARQ